MRRWLTGCSIAFLFCCCLLPALVKILFPLDFLVNITFGWFIHFFRILQRIQFRPVSVLTVLVCFTVVSAGLHLLLSWSYTRISVTEGSIIREWPVRRTASILALIMLMIVAGISAVGVINHSIEIVTSGEPFAEGFCEPSPVMQSMNDMKQIGLGMHNFSSTNNGLPSAASWDEAKQQPLLSWRILILPFIENRNSTQSSIGMSPGTVRTIFA